MKAVTKYQADDGAEFATMVEAVARDGEVATIGAIMSQLKPRPKGCDFTNGNRGYVQHERAAFEKVWHQLIEESAKRGKHVADWIVKNAKAIATPGECDATWFCRFIDDGSPLCSAWGRLCSFDANAREYGQPYYRWHPTKATNQAEYDGASE